MPSPNKDSQAEKPSRIDKTYSALYNYVNNAGSVPAGQLKFDEKNPLTALNLFSHQCVFTDRTDKNACRSLNFDEFCKVEFEHGYPSIICDLIKHLTSLDLPSCLRERDPSLQIEEGKSRFYCYEF